MNPPSLFQRPMITRMLNPSVLVAALVLFGAAGCVSTPEEARAAKAIARLNDGFADELDGLMQRWSAANGEANQTAADVYHNRITSVLKRQSNLDAVVVGVSASDPSIVATCCAALGFATHKAASAKIIPALRHEHAGVRGNAALGLWLRNGEGCKLGDVMPLLGDLEPVVRQQAALLCAKVLRRHRETVGEDTTYYDAFLLYEEALTDSDELVRVHVARGLGEVGNVAAAAMLVNRGLRDKRPRVRYETARALGVLKAAAVAEDVLSSYDNEFNRHVRVQLSQALQSITGLAWESLDDWKRELPRWRAQRARDAARQGDANK